MKVIHALASIAALLGVGSVSLAQVCSIDQGKIVPLSGSDQFGQACAVSGDTCAAIDSGGRVSVYVRVAGSWTLEQQFTTGQPSGQHVGASTRLSLDGDTIAVGDPSRFLPPNGFDTGAVGIYVRTAGTWALQQLLRAADPDAGDQFGISVALRGDRLVVGAPYDSEAGANAGATYSFVRVGQTWHQDAKLRGTGAAAQQLMGVAVAFDGVRCASIGASGHTCIWQLRAAGSIQEAELPFAGRAVAIDGSRLALWNVGSCAGAPLRTFELVGSTWTETATVLNQWFGSIAMRGGKLAVGRPGNVICYTYANAAQLYSNSGGAWAADANLGPPSPATVGFGSAIAFDGSAVVVGNLTDDEAGTDAGAIWIYALGGCSTNYCTAKLNSQGCAPTIALGGAVSASAGTGAPLSTVGVLAQKSGLFIHSTTGAMSAPFHGGFLCVQSPIKRHGMLQSGGTSGNCDGVFAEDFNAYVASGADPRLNPGASVWLQCWSRDPVDLFGDSLSAAVTATIHL